MYADLVLKSNCIFDSNRKRPYKGYVAIKGNRIISIGPNTDDAKALIGQNTRIREYEDALIMAGFHDSHTHLLMAGMYKTYANLADARSEEDAVRKVWEAEKESGRQSGWARGFGWYHVFWDNGKLPTKDSLDRYFPDRPVCLVNAEAHGVWVNSKAMELAGVTKETSVPFGGEIIRTADGEPTGVFLESAAGLITQYAFVLTKEEEKSTLENFMKSASALGITSVVDVQPYFHGNMGTLAVYSDMGKSNAQTVRIHAALDLLGDLTYAERCREKYRSDKLRVDHLKQFLDGVSTTHTALMLEPYADAPGNRGISLSDLDAIADAVQEGHRRGFHIKLHACGDKSARLALDYYERAIALYGKKHCRHAIEHLEIVSEEDIPRFAKLGIVPSMQPEHIAMTQTFSENPYLITLGKERADRTWPLKTLYDTAGVLAIGSDCPVVDNNPFLEIYRGITRLHNDGKPEGGWNPSQKLSVYEALRGYTYGSAYGVAREQELGLLEKGYLADVIVMDKNLFEVAPQEILDTKILLTVMDGRIVYEKNSIDGR